MLMSQQLTCGKDGLAMVVYGLKYPLHARTPKLYGTKYGMFVPSPTKRSPNQTCGEGYENAKNLSRH